MVVMIVSFDLSQEIFGIDLLRALKSSLLSPHITSVQYCGGCSVHRRETSVLWGIASVLWGIVSVLWGIASVPVEVAQYSGG